ncbi:MAG TPA: hypothetical protein PKM48_11880, partial [Parvularculaceae bacterium]|nr:hypothetical protein [Parvularculaceae bacterium]
MIAKNLLIALALFSASASAAAAKDSRKDLVKLWKDWRAFEAPVVENCAPDYSPAAMTKKAEGLATFKARLAAINPDKWTARDTTDYALVEAEMNGLDFDLRILQPWARDPSFYASVFAEESDVPEHEGPNARPAI